MSKKIKLGIFGLNRGGHLMSAPAQNPDCEVVALCDKNSDLLRKNIEKAEGYGCKVTGYGNFDDFLKHDMDAVFLSNYATEHASFGIKALNAGKHVLSEVLACQTMDEAVNLIDAVENSGKVYNYAENYCFFKGSFELRKVYETGVLGEFLLGEGEYIHDCESIWTEITYGQKNHWRNWVPATFYCTHSIGPVMWVTGTRPTRITAYETPNVVKRNFGCRSADASIIVCQMSNGAVAKFIPWSNLKRNPDSIWYAIYGSKGMAETDRWGDRFNKINVYTEEKGSVETYPADFTYKTELSVQTGGHGGSDFYIFDIFFKSILDKPGKEYAIDVYTALDMTLPGLFGYKSIIAGNIPIDIPNLRDKAIRDKFRGDNWCLDPAKPFPGQPGSCSTENVDPDDAIYEKQALEFKKKIEDR